METRKHLILGTLRAFLRQRPGLDFGNYGDIRAYRSDYNRILKSLHDGERLLDAVAWRDSITADQIIEASKSAYSGRLEIVEDGGKVRIDYTAGQYWPTEYRNAVCAVLSSVLWHYWADGAKDADDIRKQARNEFGARFANRWFN